MKKASFIVKLIAKIAIIVLLVLTQFPMPLKFYPKEKDAVFTLFMIIALSDLRRGKYKNLPFSLAGATLFNPIFKAKFIGKTWDMIDRTLILFISFWIVADFIFEARDRNRAYGRLKNLRRDPASGLYKVDESGYTYEMDHDSLEKLRLYMRQNQIGLVHHWYNDLSRENVSKVNRTFNMEVAEVERKKKKRKGEIENLIFNAKTGLYEVYESQYLYVFGPDMLANLKKYMQDNPIGLVSIWHYHLDDEEKKQVEKVYVAKQEPPSKKRRFNRKIRVTRQDQRSGVYEVYESQYNYEMDSEMFSDLKKYMEEDQIGLVNHWYNLLGPEKKSRVKKALVQKAERQESKKKSSNALKDATFDPATGKYEVIEAGHVYTMDEDLYRKLKQYTEASPISFVYLWYEQLPEEDKGRINKIYRANVKANVSSSDKKRKKKNLENLLKRAKHNPETGIYEVTESGYCYSMPEAAFNNLKTYMAENQIGLVTHWYNLLKEDEQSMVSKTHSRESSESDRKSKKPNVRIKNLSFNKETGLYEVVESSYTYAMDENMVDQLKAYMQENPIGLVFHWYNLLNEESRNKIVRTFFRQG